MRRMAVGTSFASSGSQKARPWRSRRTSPEPGICHSPKVKSGSSAMLSLVER